MNTTNKRTAGLQAACDAYNAANPPTTQKQADEFNKANPKAEPKIATEPLTAEQYWAFVFGTYKGDETEQQVYDRACDSYCEIYGLPVEPKPEDNLA